MPKIGRPVSREFKNRAISMYIWHKIDPDADDRPPFLTQPTEPNPRRYEKRLIPGQQPPAINTSSTLGALDEQPDPHGYPEDASEMTARGRASYRLDWSVYRDRMNDFREEARAINEIRMWVDETVNKHLLYSTCQPGKGLDVWYEQLRERVGATDQQIYDDATDRYEDALWKTSSKPPGDLQAWLKEWEDAINEAIDEGVPGVQQSRDWWRQFDKAVTRFGFTMWALAYRAEHKKEIRDNKLTIRKVVNDFGAELKRDIHKPIKRTIQKDSHAASFKGVQTDRTTEPTASSPPSNDSSSTKPTKRKRKNTRGAASGCRSCGITGHTLDKCYYVFPDKAFDKWKPRSAIAQKVKDNLKNDNDLHKEVQRLRKKTKKVQFADSSSQEGLTTDTEDH
ncbi:hypothetical protein C7999DRAFT_15565 [Corynascus novoguineensis]|uniref:Gag protein n=1 Tax=Corynascus novoguineensis TaxID=1126955 RepID=A0AAN7HM67_9PEZI|nr:hypothetical protein C7999DRAFT_15565 [Corynascus novoguineensis]